MVRSAVISAYVVIILILIFGIIHFGVGVGIVATYRQFQPVFMSSLGLGAFNIIIGIYAVVVGIIGIIAIVRNRPSLAKTTGIIGIVLGVFAIASLIAGLAVNAGAVTGVRSLLAYRISTYVQNQQSINIMDAIQTRYQCCGENVWLDWAQVQLGPPGGVSSGVSGGTNVGGSGTGTLYGLPSTYTVNLPLSCCRQGGTGSTNTIGGFCTVSANNAETGFYIGGCMAPVANIVVSQITGIVFINTCLTILCFVLIPIGLSLFPEAFNPQDDRNKQPLPKEMKQEQQNQNFPPYYATNNNSTSDYNAYAAPQTFVSQI